MKLFERLRLVIQAALSDLFSEDTSTSHLGGAAAGASGLLEDRLAQAQASLDALRVELAQARALQRQAELEWQAARAQLPALDDAVDAAVGAGQDDLARQRLQALQRRQAHAGELERQVQAYAQAAEDLRREIEGLQSGLDEVRLKTRRLAEHERSAAGLEQSVQLRRELGRQLERLAEDIRRGEEQAARREDRAAALRELERRQ